MKPLRIDPFGSPLPHYSEQATDQLPFLCADDSFAQIIFSLRLAAASIARRMDDCGGGGDAGGERRREGETKSDGNGRDWNESGNAASAAAAT